MRIICFFMSLVLLLTSLHAKEVDKEICLYPAPHVSEKDALWQARLRARTLIKLDKILSWAMPLKERVFQLHPELEGISYIHQSEHMVEFARNFSYFSKKRPIISSVSSTKEDIALSCQLLKHIHSHCKNEEFMEMAAAEILSKVIAFRDLLEGMTIPVPVVYDGKVHLVNYRVDKVFALWPCMPAFGLAPDDKNAGAILLYRGTDLSLESKRGWASVLSDLDIQGPGLTAFLKSREEIQGWLKKNTYSDTKPRVMGFSLGGVLALYTYIYDCDLLSEEGSYAFNPPGVPLSVFKLWQELSKGDRGSIRVYVTRGDIIPKIGTLAGDTIELSVEESLGPLDAHVRLMCCQRSLYQYKVDLTEENKRRR